MRCWGKTGAELARAREAFALLLKICTGLCTGLSNCDSVLDLGPLPFLRGVLGAEAVRISIEPEEFIILKLNSRGSSRGEDGGEGEDDAEPEFAKEFSIELASCLNARILGGVMGGCGGVDGWEEEEIKVMGVNTISSDESLRNLRGEAVKAIFTICTPDCSPLGVSIFSLERDEVGRFLWGTGGEVTEVMLILGLLSFLSGFNKLSAEFCFNGRGRMRAGGILLKFPSILFTLMLPLLASLWGRAGGDTTGDVAPTESFLFALLCTNSTRSARVWLALGEAALGSVDDAR